MTEASIAFDSQEVSFLREAAEALLAKKREAFAAVREDGGSIGAALCERDFAIPQLESLSQKLAVVDTLAGTVEPDGNP